MKTSIILGLLTGFLFGGSFVSDYGILWGFIAGISVLMFSVTIGFAIRKFN